MSNIDVSIESEVASLMDDMICVIIDEDVVGREYKLIQIALDDIHDEENGIEIEETYVSTKNKSSLFREHVTPTIKRKGKKRKRIT